MTASLHRANYVAALAVGAVLVLTVGWTIRPTDSQKAPAPPPSELDLTRLEQVSQRRSLESTAEYFAGIADASAAHLIRVPNSIATGVVWDRSLVVIPSRGSQSEHSLLISVPQHESPVDVTAHGPNLPFVVGRMSASLPGSEPPTRAGPPSGSGAWLQVVWRTGEGRAFAPGQFLQSVPMTCDGRPIQTIATTIALMETMTGGGIFDVDGNLIGIVLRCESRPVAVAVASLEAMITAANSVEGRLLARYGVAFEQVAGPLAIHFKVDSGAMVSETWTGYPAAVAGLIPGDLIESANGRPVSATADVASIGTVPAGDATTLLVRRGSKTFEVTLTPDAPASAPAASPAPDFGLRWDTGGGGYRVESVLAEGAAAAAGVQAGDRLVRINQTAPRTMAQCRRMLTGPQPASVFVEFARGSRHWGVLLR